LFGNQTAFAKDYPFAWAANPEPVEGYKLYYKRGGNAGPPFDGTGASQGPSPIVLGKQTSFTITGLEDNTPYHFALSAYYGAVESGFSEVITVFPELIELNAVITPSSLEGPAPFTVTFDGTYSAGIIDTFNWNFGDGNTGTGSLPSHTYLTPGTYTAVLTITNTSGALAQSSVQITSIPSSPNPYPLPTAVISASVYLGKSPVTVFFDGRSSTTTVPRTLTSYSWEFGDGSDPAESATATHTYSIPGIYNATLTVRNSDGQTGESSTPVAVLPSRDINGDGKEDLTDAVLCLQVLVGLQPANLNIGTDVDGDGKIGMAELLTIMQMLAGL
jgi:PKD repeat protein